MDESRYPTVCKFPDDGRIVRDETDPGVTRYFYTVDGEKVQTFHGIREARIYADVRTVVGEIDETGTGCLGVPPGVVQHSQDAAKAYLRATVGVSCGGIPLAEARRATNRVWVEAEEKRQYKFEVRANGQCLLCGHGDDPMNTEASHPFH